MIENKFNSVNNIDEPIEFLKLNEIEKNVLINWINENISFSIKTCPHSSYSLKHRFEEDTGKYIDNGTFKGAMLLCSHLPINKNLKNWYYKIKYEVK